MSQHKTPEEVRFPSTISEDKYTELESTSGRLLIGVAAAAVAFAVTVSVASESDSVNSTPDELLATPTELVAESPSTSHDLSPTPSPNELPTSTPSPEIVLQGVPDRVTIPELGVEFKLDSSDGYLDQPNNCGRYNNPCAGEGDLYQHDQYNLGVPGRDKLSFITLHTSSVNETGDSNVPDIGSGLIDNPIDSYTHTGLEVGDQIRLSGYDNSRIVVAEVVPFPGMTAGQDVPNSPARYLDKQEGLPPIERNELADFIDELYAELDSATEKYIIVANSYAGTGENGFEMSPDGSGRKYSGLLLLQVTTVE